MDKTGTSTAEWKSDQQFKYLSTGFKEDEDALAILRRFGSDIGFPICGLIPDLHSPEVVVLGDAASVIRDFGWSDEDPDWYNGHLSYRMCRNTNVPFQSRITNSDPVDLTSWQQRQRRDIIAAGITATIYVPVHYTNGQLSVIKWCSRNNLDAARIIRDRSHQLLLVALSALRLLDRLERQHSEDEAWCPALSRRQIECLYWAACGKTRFETATILKVAEETVKDHLREAAKRLDAVNIKQAIAVAMRNGLIH